MEQSGTLHGGGIISPRFSIGSLFPICRKKFKIARELINIGSSNNIIQSWDVILPINRLANSLLKIHQEKKKKMIQFQFLVNDNITIDRIHDSNSEAFLTLLDQDKCRCFIFKNIFMYI